MEQLIRYAAQRITEIIDHPNENPIIKQSCAEVNVKQLLDLGPKWVAQLSKTAWESEQPEPRTITIDDYAVTYSIDDGKAYIESVLPTNPETMDEINAAIEKDIAAQKMKAKEIYAEDRAMEIEQRR